MNFDIDFVELYIDIVYEESRLKTDWIDHDKNLKGMAGKIVRDSTKRAWTVMSLQDSKARNEKCSSPRD